MQPSRTISRNPGRPAGDEVDQRRRFSSSRQNYNVAEAAKVPLREKWSNERDFLRPSRAISGEPRRRAGDEACFRRNQSWPTAGCIHPSPITIVPLHSPASFRDTTYARLYRVTAFYSSNLALTVMSIASIILAVVVESPVLLVFGMMTGALSMATLITSNHCSRYDFL